MLGREGGDPTTAALRGVTPFPSSAVFIFTYMKYIAGDFITTPNKSVLRGQPAITQVVFMWLCSYANKDGTCYPSRKTLAKDAGITIRTVDAHLKKLEEIGVIVKTSRSDENVSRSNLYQIMLVEQNIHQGSAGNAPPPVQEMHHPRAGNAHRTISNELNNIELNNITSSSAASDVSEIIKLFESVDPKNRTNYGNITQRKAVTFLIEEYGKEEVCRRIEFLPRSNTMPFFPTITTPVQLKEKWVSLESAAQRHAKKDYKSFVRVN